MDIRIRDYRGIERADIQMAGVALIAGPNGAGKTSIAQAVAAVLTGQTVPITGLRKADAGALVRSGSAGGEVSLVADDGAIASIVWPKAERATEGKPPMASIYAVGLSSVLDLDAKRRAAVLIDYLGADPTRSDIVQALADIVLPDGGPNMLVVDKVWESIQTDGWDAAYERAKSTGQKLKGRWEQVAGEAYGSKKADTWQPLGWDSELTGASEEGLQTELSRAREFLEAAISGQAVDSAKLKELADSAARCPGLTKRVADLASEHRQSSANLAAAEGELRALPVSSEAIPVQICPECGSNLVVIGEKIQKHAANRPDPAETAKREAEIAAKRASVETLRRLTSEVHDEWKAVEHDLRQAIADKKALDDTPTDAGTTLADVDPCREVVRIAEMRLTAFQRKSTADREHASVGTSQIIIDALAPTGVRQKRLVKMLGTFNDSLRPLCVSAKWSLVTVSDALDIRYGGRPFPLLSASEQYRVRVILTLAMARIDGSAALVFDAADVLDRDGRNGLLRLAFGFGLPVLVGMTLPREDADKAAASGKAAVYWLNDGVAERLTPSEQRNAA